jgi:hypothetical protein
VSLSCENTAHCAQLALERSWDGPFHGKGTEALMCVVRAICSDRDMYHNALAILQSSGTGKSRLVHEISKSYFMFPMCLRDNSGAGAGEFHMDRRP